MKPWQIRLEQLLRAPDAPPVLTRDLLERFARSSRESAGHNYTALSRSSFSHWIKHAVQQGKLQTVQRGLYLNYLRASPGVLADAMPWLQRDAVVSLNTVLGDAGVLNNPTTIITAVVPIDAGAPPPARLGRKKTRAGSVHFFGIPRRLFEAGAVEDRLQPSDAFEHPRATPEKALLDWLYLGASPRSRRTPPPRADIDLSMLNAKRLARLARASGQEKMLTVWRQRD